MGVMDFTETDVAMGNAIAAAMPNGARYYNMRLVGAEAVAHLKDRGWQVCRDAEVERLTNVLREARAQAWDRTEQTMSPAWSELYFFLDAALDMDPEGRTEPLPEVAHTRTTDPSTSHLAAASIDDLADRHYAVYEALDYIGHSTDQELEAMFDYCRERLQLKIGPQSGQSLRTRRSELAKAGHVEWTGEHRPTKSGRKARVWRTVHPDPF